MKKRRELDALVNNGKGSKSSRHELLRNESDSSEVEEFTVPQKSVVRQRVRSQCCSTCLTMCATFLLVICAVSIGGLFWTVIQLKSDVSSLHDRLSNVEMAAKNINGKLSELSANEEQISTKVDSLTSTDSGMPKLQTSVSEFNRRLALVNKTLLQLAETVSTLQTDSSRTALSDLQDQMNQLSRTVAGMGSSLQSIQEKELTVAQELGDLQIGVKALQVVNDNLQTTPPKIDALDHVQQELIQFSNDLTEMNETLSRRFENLNQVVRNQYVERHLNGTSMLTDNFSLQVESLRRRMDLLEVGEFNLTTAVFDLASSFKLFNETFRVGVSQNLLNATAQGLMDQLQRVEAAVDNFETLVEPVVIPSETSASDEDASHNTDSSSITTPAQGASSPNADHQSH